MKNLEIKFPLVDGSLLPLEFNTGEQLILHLIGDDIRPPVASVYIKAKTKDGKKSVLIMVTNSNDEEAIVEIKEEL